MFSLPSARDARLAGIPALVLALVMTAYMLLETARDALFLSNMDASRLPWVYLVIALFALSIAQLQRAGRSFISGRLALTTTLVVSAIGTSAFWFVGVTRSSWLLGALYSWTGVLITLVMLQFWSVLASQFDATSAKRIFPLIAAGSTAGALAGSGLATAITRMGSDTSLLPVAGGIFLVAGLVVPLFPADVQGDDDATDERTRPTYREMFKGVLESAYALRVAGVLVTGAIALTLLDYVFKASVAENIDSDGLGTFFASFYLYLNLASFVVQVVFARWLVDRIGVVGVAVVLPVCLLLGSVGAAALGVFFATLGMKSVDGALRHTLHRTSQELLFVPMSERVRDVLKPLTDTLGHRGGQALASLIILFVTQTGRHWRTTSVILAVFALAWVVQVVLIRRSYVDNFRSSLESLATGVDLDFADLDRASVEELVAALDSPDDRQVLAALEMLCRDGRTRLVTSLIVFHPSDDVVVRSMRLFADAGQVRVIEHSIRRIEHASMRVQVAITLAIGRLNPTHPALARWAEDETLPAARIAALCVANGSGGLSDDDAHAQMTALMDQVPEHAMERMLPVLATSLAVASDGLVERWTEAVLRGPVAARRAMLRTFEGRDSGALVEVLIASHADAQLLETTRRITSASTIAVRAAARALINPLTPTAVRRELPGTLAEAGSVTAVEPLLTTLETESDGLLRYRCLRALERLVEAAPHARPAPARLHELLDRELTQGLRSLWLQLSLEATAPDEPPREHHLLTRYLHDTRVQTTERVVRILGIGQPTVATDQVFLGLRSDGGRTQAAARELLDADTPAFIREQVNALVEQGEDDDRLAGVVAADDELEALESYPDALAACLQFHSATVRALAAAIAASLALHDLAPLVGALEPDEDPLLQTMVRAAGERLRKEAS